MTTAAKTHEFQAEARQLLDLVIHSLYSHEEVFLRELVSNASDALDKLRFAALTEDGLRDAANDLAIDLEVDADARTLAIVDNGIGMDEDELVANLGSIASSGTRRFMDELAGTEKADVPELIGRFGVGFYAAFMVADRVVVETRKAGGEQGHRWESTGDGAYTIEPVEKAEHGTRVVLHLTAPDAERDDAKDFTKEWTIRETIRRYSDFVEYPIRMEVERTEQPEEEGAEPVTTRETVTLNSMRPLWTKSKGEVSDEEYAEFYKHLAHDWNDPLDTIHFKAEGTLEYSALLFVPKAARQNLFDPEGPKSSVQLYVRRVFISDQVEDLVPVWLRFLVGVVDSADLPLNVSRETLQYTRQLGQIRKRVTRKAVDAFKKLCADRREDWEGFWGEFGPAVKEGLYFETDLATELAEACLFRSTHDDVADGYTTLDEYLARKPEGQEAIYVITGPDMASIRSSAHLEAYRAKGYEVLLLADHVDEFWLSRLETFRDVPIRAIHKGGSDLDDEASKKELEAKEAESKELLDAVGDAVGDQVSGVGFSSRLVDSPAVLVVEEGAAAPHVERAMRAAGQGLGMEAKRRLELNPEHAVVKKLEGLRSSDPERFARHAQVLYGQALLAEGSPLPDPAAFTKLVAELLAE